MIAGAIIFMTACSKKIVNQSTWQSNVIVADGNSSDWEMPLNYYDKDTKCGYTISNDTRNLYLCFSFADEMTQMKILHAGMEIWLDTLGKKKHTIGILFPLPSVPMLNREAGEPYMNGRNGKRPDKLSARKKFLSEYHELELVGFSGAEEGLIPRENVYGIHVNINWDENNNMIYESVIPFKTFYKDSLSSSDNTKVFALNLIIKAQEMPQMGPGMRPAGNMGMPGGGMIPRNMSPGGGGVPVGRYSSDRQAMFQESSMLTRFKLTVQ